VVIDEIVSEDEDQPPVYTAHYEILKAEKYPTTNEKNTDEKTVVMVNKEEEVKVDTKEEGFIMFMVKMFILPIAVLAMLYSHFRSSVNLEE